MHARYLLAGFASVSVATALACGACDRAGSRGDGVVIRDSSGIRIVENERPLWRDGDGWRVDSVPLLTIGSALDGDPAAQFTRVTGVVRLSDGRIAVTDGQSAELRIFDANGRHLRTSGGKGSGPGEYPDLSGPLLLPGDTLVLSSLMPPVSGVHAPDGTFLRRVELPRVEANSRPAALIHRFPDGSSLAQRAGFTIVQPRIGTWLDFLTLYRIPAGADSAEVFGRFPSFGFSGKGRMIASVGFAPRLWIVPHEDRVYIGYPERYEVARYSADGRLVALIRRAWAPVAVDQAARDAHARRTLGDNPTPIQRERLAIQTYADNHPAYAELRVDRVGNLWAREPRLDPEALATFDPPPAPSRWSVFDSSGVWLGDVALPARLEPRDMGDDHVVGIFRDDDGVQYVRLHRLVKS